MGKKGNNSNSSTQEKMIEMTTFSNLFADEKNIVSQKKDEDLILEDIKEDLARENEKIESINDVDDEDSDIEEKKTTKKKKKEKVVVDQFEDINNVIVEEPEEEVKEEKIVDEAHLDLKSFNNSIKEEEEEIKDDSPLDLNELNDVIKEEPEEEEIDKEGPKVEKEKTSEKKDVNKQSSKDMPGILNIDIDDIDESKSIPLKDEAKDKNDIKEEPKEKDKEKKSIESIEDDNTIKQVESIDNTIKDESKKVEDGINTISKIITGKSEEIPEFKTSAKHEEMSNPSDPKGDLLPKAQKNHLSDMIDQFNANNNTRLSTKDITKYLQNQFFKGQGESVNDKRESFKKAYQDFCKEVYKNMLEKRNNLPANKRQSIENTQKDFDALAQQIANVCKANGWMKKDFEIGPNGGLSPETMRKMQLDAVKASPQDAKQLIESQLGKTKKDQLNQDVKDLTQNLKEFSKKFKEDLSKVPTAEQGGMDSPEAKDCLMKMQALDSVHASRGLSYKLRHPRLYRQEGKLLEESKDTLQEKGYDREVINSMLKSTSLDDNDMVKSSNSQDTKDIEKLYKNNQKASREFEEKKEKEEHELKQQIKGMRKKISVPEADTTKEIVNPKERSQRVELTVNKTMQMEFSAPGGKK